MNRQNRLPGEARPLIVERGASRHAEGSALIRLGHTHVLVTVSVEHKVPFHVRGKKTGWLMAEYDMLPRATHERVSRERNQSGGRRQEIQRLMGRALRTCVDLDLFRDKTLIVDADVLQADGGTRVASILGAYAALFDLSDRLIASGKLSEWPLRHEVGAVSVGLVDAGLLLDLDYQEDQGAHADLNVVATGSGQLLEVQGGAEGVPLDPQVFSEMVVLGLAGVQSLLSELRRQL
ncbi:ribonuclease PH [Deinococcus peraridilitoris]|uniref:Ribonuclease PH n=1 Tax=Deinococcus peraridilitoris (strain DSM 19664 / LMG 22246 / CIP 109416 / KR-200) TaxID=937777 RepID=L0A4T6_DEIPD|nr:ribonuclease PH [Deinococcus peraridilitoris]AFZ68871.1 ribonuclease PH [Deinococcus peraridilitoris DSM 19664]